MKLYRELIKNINNNNLCLFKDNFDKGLLSSRELLNLFKQTILSDSTKILDFLIDKARPLYTKHINSLLRHSCVYGRLDIFNTLILNKKINTSYESNICIRESYTGGYKDIAYLLFQHKDVINTLKQDNINLYNQISKELIALLYFLL